MSAVTSAARVRGSGARRPFVVLLVAAALAALFTLLLAPAGPAQAAAYRYWGYYQLQDSTWAFANKGPAQITPKDGSVEGWRFAISGASKDVRAPRAVLAFEDICGDTDAQSGKKRIGVVIDYGRAADGAPGAKPPEPVAECAVVDEAAHSDEALSSVAGVRASKGLVCAVDGYPDKGCGDQVKDVPAAAKKPDTPVKIMVAGSTASSPETPAAQSPAPSAGQPPAPTASSAAAAAPSSNPSAADDAQAAAADNQSNQSDQDGGVGTGTWVGIVVVVLAILAVLGVALRRRGQA